MLVSQGAHRSKNIGMPGFGREMNFMHDLGGNWLVSLIHRFHGQRTLYPASAPAQSPFEFLTQNLRPDQDTLERSNLPALQFFFLILRTSRNIR